MSTLSAKAGTAPNRFENGEIHDWYRIILGYSDHLVAQLLTRLNVDSSTSVLDPFCGTGTTLIECMKAGVPCTGIDANPSSVFAARVKTDWQVDPDRILKLLDGIETSFGQYARSNRTYRDDPTFSYLENAGMLKRKWISPEPLRKALALKRSIIEHTSVGKYRDVLMLALIAEVVEHFSNVRFGPQLYCSSPKLDVDALPWFSSRVQLIAAELEQFKSRVPESAARVYKGDSRNCAHVLRNDANQPFGAVICSPPYPTEHDYTRHSRLELAFLEQVHDRKSVQAIKRKMIRSHTKGIYKEDEDGDAVASIPSVKVLTEEITKRIAGKTHGFARLYPKLINEYFGGMRRHFIDLKSVLKPGAKCAYVVGDQGSFLQVHVPTAAVLEIIAQEAGFCRTEIVHWRSRWSTVTSSEIDEHILLFEKPA